MVARVGRTPWPLPIAIPSAEPAAFGCHVSTLKYSNRPREAEQRLRQGAEFAGRLKPGMRQAVPLGALGEIGVEAG